MLCKHPERTEIERRIAVKALLMTQATKLIHSNKSTISRHMRNCVAKAIAERVRPEPMKVDGLNVVNQLLRSHQTTMDILAAALASGDNRVAVKALEVEMKQLELTAKFTGQSQDASQLNFLLTSQYAILQKVFARALESYPEERQKVARALKQASETYKPVE